MGALNHFFHVFFFAAMWKTPLAGHWLTNYILLVSLGPIFVTPDLVPVEVAEPLTPGSPSIMVRDRDLMEIGNG